MTNAASNLSCTLEQHGRWTYFVLNEHLILDHQGIIWKRSRFHDYLR